MTADSIRVSWLVGHLMQLIARISTVCRKHENGLRDALRFKFEWICMMACSVISKNISIQIMIIIARLSTIGQPVCKPTLSSACMAMACIADQSDTDAAAKAAHEHRVE